MKSKISKLVEQIIIDKLNKHFKEFSWEMDYINSDTTEINIKLKIK